MHSEQTEVKVYWLLAFIMSPPNYRYTSPNSQYTFTSVYSLWYDLNRKNAQEKLEP